MRNNSTALCLLGKMIGCLVSNGNLALLNRPLPLRTQLESMTGDRQTILLFEEIYVSC